MASQMVQLFLHSSRQRVLILSSLEIAALHGGSGFWTPHSSIGSAVFAAFTTVTDQHTDHTTPPVTIGCIYAYCTVMWPNNVFWNILQTVLLALIFWTKVGTSNLMLKIPPPLPQPFYGPFSGTTRVTGARRELLDFMVQGKINRGRHTDHPTGRHSIQTDQCPPPPSPIFYRPDAIPATQPTVPKHWRQLAHSD